MLETSDNQESNEAEEEYRSWSLLAVVAVVLGFFSAAALASPLLWFIPLLTLVLGASALRSLAKNPEKTGRRAVLVAITLALLFIAWAPARYFSRQWYLYRQAQTLADTWLELVRTKQLRKAHQLQMEPVRRVPDDMSVDEFYDDNSEARSEVFTQLNQPPLDRVIAHQGTPTIEFEYPVSHNHEALTDTVVLRYSIHFEKDRQPVSLPIDVVLICKTNPYTHQREWHVGRFTTPESN